MTMVGRRVTVGALARAAAAPRRSSVSTAVARPARSVDVQDVVDVKARYAVNPVLFAEQVPTEQLGERVPLAHWFGGDKPNRHYNYDDLVQRKDLDVYERMGVDDQVAAALRVKKISRLASGYRIEAASDDPRDHQIRQFVHDAISHIPGTFDRKLEQFMTAIQYGFSVSEKVWMVAPSGPWRGRIVYQNIKAKSPFSFYFRTDPYGNIAPDGIEIRQVWGASTIRVGDRLARDKFVVWSYNPPFEDPYGRSDLRSCYRSWFSKDYIIKLFNLHIEKFASPTAMAFLPDNLNTPEIQRVQTVLDTIQNLTSATFPEGVDVKYMESRLGGAIAFKFQDAVDMHNRFIARALLVPDMLGYSGGSQGGSFALGRKQIDVFFSTLASLAHDLEETVVGQQIIKPLVDMNFADVARYPRFRFNEQKEDLAVRAKIVQILAQAGMVDARAPWLAEYLDLPTSSLPPPHAAVFTAKRDLMRSHGVFLGSTVCHGCLKEIGRDFVADQHCRVAYHSECLSQAGGSCWEGGGHKDQLIRVRLDGDQGDHRARKWSAPRRPAPAPEVHTHAESAPTPLERATHFDAIRSMLDSLGDKAIAAARPVFETMRDRLLDAAKRRDVTAFEKLVISPAPLQKLLRSYSMTIAGNSAVEAAGEIRRKAAKYEEHAEDPAQAKELLEPRLVRSTLGKVQMQTRIGLVRLDLGGFLDDYFAQRATDLAGGEVDWITSQARTIFANAIRQGDPTRAQEQIAALFDTYMVRGKKGADREPLRPARLWTLLDTLGGTALNEGRRSVFTCDAVAPHVVAFQWCSKLDALTSQYCRRMHGQVFRPEQMLSQFPPAHLHCRSLLIAVMEWEEFALSPVDPQSPAAGVRRPVGFSENDGEVVSVILPLRGGDADWWANALERIKHVCPNLEPSSGPPHVTLMYATGIAPEQVQPLTDSVRTSMAWHALNARTHAVETMQNAEGDTVVYVDVSGPEVLQAADELRAAALAFGGQFQYPQWKGHITIGYFHNGASPEEEEAATGVDVRPRLLEFPAGSAEVSVRSTAGWVRMREEKRRKAQR